MIFVLCAIILVGSVPTVFGAAVKTEHVMQHPECLCAQPWQTVKEACTQIIEREGIHPDHIKCTDYRGKRGTAGYPLYRAACEMDEQFVRYLLAQGAHPDKTGPFEGSYIEGVSSESFAVESLLSAYGKKGTLFADAVRKDPRLAIVYAKGGSSVTACNALMHGAGPVKTLDATPIPYHILEAFNRNDLSSVPQLIRVLAYLGSPMDSACRYQCREQHFKGNSVQLVQELQKIATSDEQRKQLHAIEQSLEKVKKEIEGYKDARKRCIAEGAGAMCADSLAMALDYDVLQEELPDIIAREMHVALPSPHAAAGKEAEAYARL